MRYGRARDGAIGHSAVSSCTRWICQNTTFCSSTQFRWKYDDLLRYFFSIRLLSRRNADVRRRSYMAQIRRYLLIGCEGLLDINMDHACRCLHVERAARERLDFSNNSGNRRGRLRGAVSRIAGSRRNRATDDERTRENG